jgi:1,4-dihydroxy-2-naphthoate octaprenyltransferase
VRLGDRRTRVLYRACLAGAFLVVPIAVAVDAMPSWALLSAGAILVAARPSVGVREASGRGLIPVLVGTGLAQVAFGALLAFGLWVA